MKTDAQKVAEIKNFLKEAKDQIHRAEQVLENMEVSSDIETVIPVINEDLAKGVEPVIAETVPVSDQNQLRSEPLPQESVPNPVAAEDSGTSTESDHELAQEVLDRPSNSYTVPVQTEQTVQEQPQSQPVTQPIQPEQTKTETIDPGVKELDI